MKGPVKRGTKKTKCAGVNWAWADLSKIEQRDKGGEPGRGQGGENSTFSREGNPVYPLKKPRGWGGGGKERSRQEGESHPKKNEKGPKAKVDIFSSGQGKLGRTESEKEKR